LPVNFVNKLEQSRAGLGEEYLLPLYIKQLNANAPFQGPDVVGYRWLSQAQLVGSGGYAIAAGYEIKDDQAMKV
jgi:hypothetical protein